MAYAGVWRRFVAVVIDGIVLFLFALALAMKTGGTYSTDTGAGFTLGTGPALAWLGCAFTYYVVLELAWGMTVGKALTGMRVVNRDGRPITLGQALIRNIVRPVDALFFYLVAAVAAWTSPARQRLGDRAAVTFVVRW